MGYLRFFLALTVVSFHSVGLVTQGHGQSFLQIFTGLGGTIAVEIFFVISGFYMAMILESNYKSRLKAFYLNRALRIYPVYWVCLGTYLLFGFFNPSANPFYWLTNMFLVGGDSATSKLLGLPDDSLIIRPAWTLTLELAFYLVAPLLVRLRTPVLLVIATTLSASKLFVAGFLLDKPETWTFVFLPFEFAYFFAGIVVWRLRTQLAARLKGDFYLTWATAIVVLLAAGIRYLANEMLPFFLSDYVIPLGFVILVALQIPRLMDLFQLSSGDRWIGDLSYPIYISHLFVVDRLIELRNAQFPAAPDVFVFLVIIASAIGAGVLLRTVDLAMANVRSKIRGADD